MKDPISFCTKKKKNRLKKVLFLLSLSSTIINNLGMFTAETHKLLLCNIQPVKDKLIVLTVKEG